MEIQCVRKLLSSCSPSLEHLQSFWGWWCATVSVATLVLAIAANSLHF